MSEPTFSLVVPTFNGGKLLRACVASILAQNYPHFEVLLLDDGSTDGSLASLDSLQDQRLKIHRAQHVGIAANWNRVLGLPKNEFMAFVGQDDWLDPHYLQTMAALIQKHPNAGLYHAAFRFIDARGQKISLSRPAPEVENGAAWLRAHFRGERDTWGSGYLWRNADFERIGGIPAFETLLFADDALWFSLMEGAFKATSSRECFAIRVHTHSTGRAARWEAWLAALEKYIPFLQQMAARDVEFARVLAQCAPDYFGARCRDFYFLSLAQAAKQARRDAGAALEPLCAALQLIAPQKVAELREFAASKACRRRQFIAQNPLARGLYNFYLLARYREWRGRPLHLSRAKTG